MHNNMFFVINKKIKNDNNDEKCISNTNNTSNTSNSSINKSKNNKDIVILKNPQRIAVFDMDETLGYFSQIYIVWRLLMNTSKRKLSIHNFFSLCDIFPDVFRPGIISIIKELKEHDIPVVIYTNNNGEKWWAKLIVYYINHKLGCDVHDGYIRTIIGAFIVNGKIVDNRRTTMKKTFNDLRNILKLNNYAQVLFVDDIEHPGMRHLQVDYIKIPPYVCIYNTNDIINTLLRSQFGKLFILKNKLNLQEFIKKFNYEMSRYGYYQNESMFIKNFKNELEFDMIRKFTSTYL